jgi:dihydrodipicolinate synthase/N-acetylneuraminate lyase
VLFSCFVMQSGSLAYFPMRKDDSVLKGLVVPVPTPFTAGGVVDLGAFLSHLDWLAECGVRNLLVNGTTGEFFSLTPEEQMNLLQVARASWNGTLVFHLGQTALGQPVSPEPSGGGGCLETAHAAEDEGADFIASLPPFYPANLPQDGLVEWFSRLALETDLPLILYNFPKHTGNPLTSEILKQVPHWGMKDSSGDLSLIPATPNYFVGGDRKISAAYAAGAVGFVSASANIDPLPYLQIEKEQTPELQAEVDAVNARTSGPFAIANIKQALSEILPGYPAAVRPPLSVIRP